MSEHYRPTCPGVRRGVRVGGTREGVDGVELSEPPALLARLDLPAMLPLLPVVAPVTNTD